ncbi:g6315 [Coccomyxa viridis]|uniref:G6315 protein n=1 Tax=Coccomyxa viridis TaxID=1274662 RepID=A0ABP1FZZ4_9CHLO
MDAGLPIVRTVIGWQTNEHSERAIPSSPSPLPISPLKQMLQQQPQSSGLPRLRIKLGAAVEESGGTLMLRCRTSTEECSSSMHTSSPPISIPYSCARSDSAGNVECQILEDLSLDAEAFRTRLPCSNGGAPQATVIDCGMSSAPARCSTVAEAQLQDLLHNAMQQGQGEMHMVSVVEAMLHAAAEHDRMLLDCEHELLHHPDDCMFDIDLAATLTCP